MGLCVHRLAEENAAAAARGSTVPSQGQPPSWRVMADGAACGCGPGLARPRAGQRVGSPRRASGVSGSQEGLDPDGPMQCLAALKNLLAPRYLTPAAIPPTELLAIFSLLEGTAPEATSSSLASHKAPSPRRAPPPTSPDRAEPRKGFGEPQSSSEVRRYTERVMGRVLSKSVQVRIADSGLQPAHAYKRICP